MTPASAQLWQTLIDSGRYAALKPAAMRVLGYLVARHTPGERFDCLTGIIAPAAGLSCKHTNRALRELERLGLLRRIADELSPAVVCVLVTPKAGEGQNVPQPH